MDGLPAPQPKRTQSIFKSSICSPEGPVKNQFSNPPKVLGITHFSAVWKVSTPAARIVHIDGEMRDAARTLRHRGGDQLHQEAAELHKGQLPLLFRRVGGGPEMQAAADLLVKGDAGIHIRRIHGNVAETLIVLFHTISPPVCEK